MRYLFAVSMILLIGAVAYADALIEWDFDTAEASAAWQPNSFLANVKVADGVFSADAVDFDPFLSCHGLSFETTPWQRLVIRMRASASGAGELFWSGQTEGPYGGLSQEKSIGFAVEGGAWQDVVIYPFWQAEGVMRQLRLDLYNGAHFDIETIRVETWFTGEPVAETAWTFDGKPTWHHAGRMSFAPPPASDLTDFGFAVVQLRATVEEQGAFVWATANRPGLQEEPFAIPAQGDQFINIELTGLPAWRNVVAFGLRLPDGVAVQGFSFAQEAQGPAVLHTNYFGIDQGYIRAGRPVPVLLQVENTGGDPSTPLAVHFEAAKVDAPFDDQTLPSIERGDRAELRWTVTFPEAGTYALSAKVGEDAPVQASVHVWPARAIEPADYVPAPQPVETQVDVLAYYFPGWEADAKWDPIRGVAPERKPILGWYDESKPEIVDWQIKWAVEHGIKGFLVDWYWVKGSQHLTHWFDAYREARYRDDLQVAIMWANHNPPGTHSRDDWRNVTQEWIDHYFNLPAYYKVDGKPAIYLWDPRTLFNDLGGTDEVKAALAESQQMARDAGYEGISFIVMGYGFGDSDLKRMRDEGYMGFTTYHEWGDANASQPGLTRPFQIVADTVEDTWQTRHDSAKAAGMAYYPVADTGWDSRPWHGAKSYVLENRTVDHFRTILEKAKTFIRETGGHTLILGPMNEWGEGSYIEPNTEYGFAMMDQIREVFSEKPAEGWPENITPEDVARGPYDYPPTPVVTSWTFDDGPQGWRTFMGMNEAKVEGGALVATTSTTDPAFVVSLDKIRAKDFATFEITMQCEGDVPNGATMQLFWSVGGGPTSESASLQVPLQRDGKMHTYTFPLDVNPRWRGRVSMLRIDPCGTADITLRIAEARLR